MIFVNIKCRIGDEVMTNYNQMSDSGINAAFLILSGGLLDAYTYCCRGGVFANAQTGNLVLMGKYLFEGNMSYALRYFVPICTFIIGTFLAEYIHRQFKYVKVVHWRQIVVVVEILLLFAVGLVPNKYDVAANIIVSFVCAMQVQTFRTIDGLTYSSTMCTGNMRYAAELLCLYFHSKDKKDLNSSLKYFGVIVLFAIGAGMGGILTVKYGILAVWTACVLLFICFLIMYN